MLRSAFLPLAALIVLPIQAQNVDIESLAGFQLTFSNPGARSMGMGGAFLGLADDASAAESNPAGLTILRAPEISIELREFQGSQDTIVGGEFPQFERMAFPTVDTGLEVSFASVVYPFQTGAVALYFHKPINYQIEINPSVTDFFGIPVENFGGSFFLPMEPLGQTEPVDRETCTRIIEEASNPFACLQFLVFPFVTDLEAEQTTVGLSVAYEVGPVSLGASARYQRLSSLARTRRLDLQILEIDAEVVQATMDGDDFGPADDWTFVGGFKWRITDQLMVGGSYKQGAEFPTNLFVDHQDGSGLVLLAEDVRFHLPDSYGIGIAWQPRSDLTIAADVVGVTYSNLADDFHSIYREMQVLGQDAYTIRDATELHLGFEYFLPNKSPLALRAGWWHDPAHRLEYTGPTTCGEPFLEIERFFCSANRTVIDFLFPAGEDQDHWTLGLGLVFDKISVDAALDKSDISDTVSLSAVYHF